MNKYTFFWGGPFSNWAKCSFTYKGTRFTSSEQAMMWMKAQTFADDEASLLILSTSDPKKQKAIGRKIRGYDDEVWARYRYEIVVDILRHKFTQCEDMRDALLATRGTILVEASPVDTIWGIGLGAGDPLAQDESTWKGLNLLGKALTEIRIEMENV